MKLVLRVRALRGRNRGESRTLVDCCRELLQGWRPTTDKPVYRDSDDLRPNWLGSSNNPVFGQVAFYGKAKIEDVSGFPPLIPRVWSGYPWSLQRYQLSGEEGRIRLIVPRLAEGVDYKVEVLLTR